ncbi:MAG: Uncharacterised protein [Gammaproteobacteria bacterium]|nr:MAG: Uncharacterised protein [Gammaproteobacteria bacterium]
MPGVYFDKADLHRGLETQDFQGFQGEVLLMNTTPIDRQLSRQTHLARLRHAYAVALPFLKDKVTLEMRGDPILRYD